MGKTVSNVFINFASFIGMMTVGMTYGSLGVLLVPISQYFGSSLISVGYPLVFYSLGFLAGTLFISAAWQIRRARLMLTLFSLINIITLFLIYGVHPNLTVVLILLMISGMAGAVIHSGLDSFFAEIYPQNRAKMLNILHVFFGLGGFLGPFLIGFILAANIPWYLIFLLMSFLSAPLPMIYSRASLYHPIRVLPEIEKEKGTSQYAPRSTVLTPLFWVVLASVFFYVSTETAMTSWTPVFLTGVRQLTPSIASFSVSLVWLTIIVGRIFFSRYLKFHNLSLFLVVSALANIFIIFMVYSIQTIVPEFIFLVICGLLFSFMYPGLLAQGSDLFPRQIGYVIGAMGASGTVGSIFTPWVLGPLSQRFSLEHIVFLPPVFSLITGILLMSIYRHRRIQSE